MNPRELTNQRLAAGRYVVAEKLGEGGHAEVYVARDTANQREVVIKIPRLALLAEAEFVERFRREIRSLATLSHPHVVRILDFGEEQEQPFAVLEYIPGGTLEERIHAGGASVDELASWLPGIASALDYLHTRGCIHRDVKPANIMFKANGTACLTDFGIIRAIDTNQSAVQGLTTTGFAMGTAEYMAPELCRGEQIDGRVDQYALGVTVFEYLAGMRPLEGPTPLATIGLQLTATPPSIRTRRPDLTTEAVAAVDRMLQKQADQRFPTCQAASNAILGGAYNEGSDSAEPRGMSNQPTLRRELAHIRCVCPQCQRKLLLPAHRTGSRMRCPSCEHEFRAQASEQPTGPVSGTSTLPSVPPSEATTRVSQAVSPYSPRFPTRVTKTDTRSRRNWIEVFAKVGGWARTVSYFLLTLTLLVLVVVLLVVIFGDRSPVDLLDTATEFMTGITPTGGQSRITDDPDSSVATGESSPPAHASTTESTPLPNDSFDSTDRDLPPDGDLRPQAEAATMPAPPQLVAPFDETEAETAQRQWADHLGVDVIIENSIGMQLRMIPPGEFLMGSDQSPELIANSTGVDSNAYADEQPQHLVRLTEPFFIGAHEVTQRQWQAVMASNPSWFATTGGGADEVDGMDTSEFPVDSVSWFDAIEFCNALSSFEDLPDFYLLGDVTLEDQRIIHAEVSISGGSGYRLPTEAEWEYACRAGTLTTFHFGNSADGRQSNVNGHLPWRTQTVGPNLGRPTSIGHYATNAFGLRDMHGNVWEWCWDAYDPGAYIERIGISMDPVVNAPTERRSLRGGAWRNAPHDSRAADRYGAPPDGADYGGGFRVVRTPEALLDSGMASW